MFGRRRSSDAASPPAHNEFESLKRSLSHRPPDSPQEDHPNNGGFRNLFRRHINSPDITSPTATQGKEKSSPIEASAPAPPKSPEESSGRHDDSKDPHGPPRHDSPVTGAEPTQPGNIHDHLESRLEMAGKPKENLPVAHHNPKEETKLTAKDIKAIFSGAPHFMLERGNYHLWYPQVIFPWDDHNPVIQHMWDRKPLPHASFTLSTLHAHLPLPDDWAIKGGVPIKVLDWRQTDATNRATFDVGIFEVPNMLSNNGKEPGTVGFRHFLELPVADTVRYVGPEKPKKSPHLQQISTMAATVAFDIMEGYGKPYSQCRSGAVHDRHKLICEGPEAWKRIGVRDINLRTLVQRLEHLRQFRHEMLTEGSTKTILDIESPRELHDSLHTQFLHPQAADIIGGHAQSIKSQIKTLSIVLATPGAWINFSLPEWRFRVGQVLWEASLHGDGDCLGPSSGDEKVPWDLMIKSGMERKWLLIQMLLSAELLLRLDAFVRAGMLRDAHSGHITMRELGEFENLRDGKLNWDLVVVRRFLSSLDISCPPPQSGLSPDGSRLKLAATKSHRFSLFETISRHSPPPVADLKSAWDCELSSSHIRQQLEGLYVFAENVGWPKLAALKAAMEFKLGDPHNPVLPALVVHDRWGWEEISQEMLLAKEDMYTRDPCRRRVKLSGSGDPQSKTLGWISRSWLSGFVIPGEGISHLLMATLLENDADAMDKLGSIANLYGGFVYDQRSWWSKACVAGRVLSSSAGAKTCMGWISSDIIPRDAITGEIFQCGWLEVPVEEVLEISSVPRIKQGTKLALESSPLGAGAISAKAFTLPTDNPEPSAISVNIEGLNLSVKDYRPAGEFGITSAEASMSFLIGGAGGAGVSTTVSFPLKYNVRFISAHECCPPLGIASHKPSDRENIETQRPTKPVSKYSRLPGHPLHSSYRYKYVSLDSLPSAPTPQLTSLVTPEATHTPEIIVIDARGNRDRETFARACILVELNHRLFRFLKNDHGSTPSTVKPVTIEGSSEQIYFETEESTQSTHHVGVKPKKTH
ncbi:hypothetical protein DTO013E5_4535 [Penicillium roqueforti]|uniref:uncharacterized protein n=1 Tax=Penicillium roqueforti TaxID=5082 RepID=UPI00190A3528|nr:uncharacterized protein LCP9604111_8773 [Penicillium roqueforti]KAF9240295.1 hypothetical protein LCP9604111_8773 [Penicillium roqueforti]KAI1835332.1 hypothetical protein CBS147337_4149 [Penicillium roqueforti]KAI2719925.1 hypothetical protein CBS147318_3231 [Penicillium roqueforti]KAI2741419.1 hypothetical protein DTO012A1_4583 [Penicillium roqueforti]KAI2754699.1 hypothetical protein DTO013F2_1836 [Penicillium roqueforti]